jgi:hypothetical protein
MGPIDSERAKPGERAARGVSTISVNARDGLELGSPDRATDPFRFSEWAPDSLRSGHLTHPDAAAD